MSPAQKNPPHEPQAPPKKSHRINSKSQTASAANFPADVTDIDAIVRALYESVSFVPDSQPDFNRLRALFHHEGRLIPPKESETMPVVVLRIEEFVKNSREYIITTGLESTGFYEREVRRACF